MYKKNMDNNKYVLLSLAWQNIDKGRQSREH